jgi:hypothetical protein
MIGGYYMAQAIYGAAKLGIADRLRGGPRTAGQLARATGTHARSLYRLLRTLAGSGIFAHDVGGRLRTRLRPAWKSSGAVRNGWRPWWPS